MPRKTLVAIYNADEHYLITEFRGEEQLDEYLKEHNYELVDKGQQTCMDNAIWVDVREKEVSILA